MPKNTLMTARLSFWGLGAADRLPDDTLHSGHSTLKTVKHHDMRMFLILPRIMAQFEDIKILKRGNPFEMGVLTRQIPGK